MSAIMDSFGSTECLLHFDVLDTLNHDIDDDRSSGYESCDSSPQKKQSKVVSANQLEIMFYSNSNALGESLQYILDMPELCDVMFVVGDGARLVYGVRAVMAARSRIFYQTIMYHQRKSDEQVRSKGKLRCKSKKETPKTSRLQIPINDYDFDVFHSIVKFTHSGRVRANVDNIIGLLCAACDFELTDLQDACWDFIKHCLKQGYQKQLIASANSCKNKKIANKILTLISSH